MAKRKLENVLVAAGLVVLVLLLSMFGSLLILIIASNKLSVDMLYFNCPNFRNDSYLCF